MRTSEVIAGVLVDRKARGGVRPSKLSITTEHAC
jgi:hypothetical protein